MRWLVECQFILGHPRGRPRVPDRLDASPLRLLDTADR